MTDRFTEPADVGEEHPDFDDHPGAAELLGLASAAAPARALRARVLDAATSARRPGRPAVEAEVDEIEEIDEIETLRRTLADIAVLVDSISAVEATARTIEGWTVAGLVGHLTAIERYFGSVLGWWNEPALDHVSDHLAMTRPTVEISESADFEDVRSKWHAATAAVVARLSDLEGRLVERVDFHAFDLSIRSLLVARTFEVWTHDEDIRRALGHEPAAPDAARLRVMTRTAVAALPLGMLLGGRAPSGRSVRVVLTGDGGGSWVQSLEFGASPIEVPAPSATLVTDAMGFCRVAAKRLDPRDLAYRYRGEADLIEDVLVAVAVFAA